ncbi:outer membrane beta-barrel protein [Rhizorhabdus argentea]|uniref:outer membrane beta-barrel protein n=1 Tax=Rhizorhabdus argentea TaxID=1387174 RepID=UPI0030EC41BD
MFRFLTAAAAVALFATPALADNVYIELHSGYDGVTYAGNTYGGIAYGAGLGYEVTLGGKVYAAVEGDIDDSSSKSDFFGIKAGRDISAVGKLGVGVTDSLSIYVLGGYTNARLKGPGGSTDLDGARVGIGWRYDVGKAYIKTEFLYSNYELGFTRYQGMAGLGYKF